MQRFGIGEMEMKMAKLLWDREGIGSGAVVSYVRKSSDGKSPRLIRCFADCVSTVCSRM